MKINRIQLISLKPAIGRGANDGSYYPIGLLTLAKAIGDFFPKTEVVINDQCHEEIIIDGRTDLIGISIPTPLCYQPAIEIAEEAKQMGKIVVIGGQYASCLYQQIMERRKIFNFLIRGKGEIPFVSLVRAIRNQLDDFSNIPSLSWRSDGKIMHNPLSEQRDWHYDIFTPLTFQKLSSGIGRYWEIFRKNINTNADAAFSCFTHFGCLFRHRQKESGKKFCCFCSLNGYPTTRDPKKILQEIESHIKNCGIPKNSRIHLKCYGDNIGQHFKLVELLAEEIEKCPWWNDYKISWTFYCQSSFVSQKLLDQLKRIGTTEIFIGFDGVNDEVQKASGLGTNKKNHWRAVDLCLKNGVKIQAASIVGLIGETPGTLEEQFIFFKKLSELNILERINSALIIIVAGSPAYEMLSEKENWIKNEDFVPVIELQKLWIKHFCPKVEFNLLREYARRINELSPGPRASMGYNK